MSETFKTFFYGFLIAVGVCLMLACSTTRRLEKHSESMTQVADTASTRTAQQRSTTATRADSTGKAERSEKATETAANETVEEIEATTYDPATGRVAAVTKTKRRTTGTAAKTSETTAKSQAETSRRLDTKTDASTTDAITAHSELKREVKDKQLQKTSRPSIRAWAGGIALVAVLASLAWFFIPKFAAYGAGGPIGLLLAFIRRKREQTEAPTV